MQIKWQTIKLSTRAKAKRQKRGERTRELSWNSLAQGVCVCVCVVGVYDRLSIVIAHCNYVYEYIKTLTEASKVNQVK